MEVMLGEAYRVITEVVGQARLRRDLAKHPVVGRAVESDLAVFYLRLVSNRGQIKERYFHASLNKCMSATVEPSSPTRQGPSLPLPARRLGRHEPERCRHQEGEPGVESNEDPRPPGEENEATHPVPDEASRIASLAGTHAQNIFQPGEGTDHSQ